MANRPYDVPDGTPLRDQTVHSVYVVLKGVRYGFPSPEALFCEGLDHSEVKWVEQPRPLRRRPFHPNQLAPTLPAQHPPTWRRLDVVAVIRAHLTQWNIPPF